MEEDRRMNKNGHLGSRYEPVFRFFKRSLLRRLLLPSVSLFSYPFTAAFAKNFSSSVSASASTFVCIGQNLGPHIEQNSAVL